MGLAGPKSGAVGAAAGMALSLHFPCVDGGVPTTLILTAIDIDRYGQLLARLDSGLSDLIRTENLETDLFRILIVCL